MSNIKEIEFNNMCRTCLSSSEDMKSLYATNFGSAHLCLAEMLMSFTPLKLSLNDGFPTQICCTCISELNQFHTFQLKCLLSEKILRNCKDKIVHTEKTGNFEEVLIKKELPTHTDNINEFEENSSNKSDTVHCSVNAIDQTYTTTKPLQDPLTITDASQELDLINQAFINIEKEDVINTPVEQETANSPGSHAESRFTTRGKSNKLAVGEKPYACTVCDSKFADRQRLATHKRTHIREKLYSCTKCSRSYTRNASLLRHIRSHKESSSDSGSLRSDVENYQSSASLQVQLTMDEIKNEMRQELDLITHELNDDINMNSNSSLVKLSDGTTTHALNETCERPYSCTICGKAFKDIHVLSGHLRTHTGLKPNKCTVCKRSFSRKTHLKDHMLIHTGVKAYSCTFCDDCFTRKSQLNIHLRKHSGEKPYTCTICNKSFHYNVILTQHLQAHSKYPCSFCDKSFVRVHLLNEHLKTHAGE